MPGAPANMRFILQQRISWRMQTNQIVVANNGPVILPILKREQHRQALIDAVSSGSHKFFLGTDSAPHSQANKESACGCAGIYSAHAAIEFYAEAFEQSGMLDKLEGFSSFHGADFYGLPRNSKKITLQKSEWTIPASYTFAGETLIPMRANESLAWQLT